MKLPADYTKLTQPQRRLVREEYMKRQDGLCAYCMYPLNDPAPAHVTDQPINWGLFPPHFLKHPIHLQHNHDTGMTEGAVHAYCNAVMWQYHGR